MTEFLQFCGHHWFVTWCALWLGWGIVWLAAIIIQIPLRLTTRLFRVIKVCARGWPPSHLDADGDWKPQPEKNNG